MKRKRLGQPFPDADRISELPEPIIHQIISLLGTKEAAKTSVLSKKFEFFWNSNPVLDFDNTYWNEWRSPQGKERFLNFMHESVRRYHASDFSPQKFRLHFAVYENDAPPADRRVDWVVRFAVRSKEVDLGVKYFRDPHNGLDGMLYKLPSDLFPRKNSIRVLKLKGFKLFNGLDLTKFPSMEELSLVSCGGFQSITVSTNMIKAVEIKNCLPLSSIDIPDSPNLRSFSYHGARVLNSVEPHPCQINIIACKFLENLEVEFTNDATDDWIKNNVSKLSFLKRLILGRCDLLTAIKFSLKKLEVFKLTRCRKLEEVEIHAPKLSSFFYNGVIQTSLTIDSPKLDAEVILHRDSNFERGWLNRLRGFLVYFGHCKSLTLAVECENDLVSLEDWREGLLPPLFDIKNLKVKLNKPVTDYVELVESLLWLAPLLETLSLITNGKKEFIKFKYAKTTTMEDNDDNDDDLCCRDRLVKCWRHYVTNVFVEHFRVYDKKRLVVFFTKQAMRLECISVTPY